MTPREVIKATLEQERDIEGVNTLADYVLHDLETAGFVIVPKEPTNKSRHGRL